MRQLFGGFGIGELRFDPLPFFEGFLCSLGAHT